MVVRNLLAGEPSESLAGRRIDSVRRRGKFLLIEVENETVLVVNPMLAGRFRFGVPLTKPWVRDAFVLRFADGTELRYHDAVDMGKVYITANPDELPGFAGQGPEANDPALSIEQIQERMRRHPGELKTMLTAQSFLAGIGNAYADEILWTAGVYPFRKRPGLSHEESRRLASAIRPVLDGAIEELRHRVGDEIEIEIRDFLQVHGKPGQPCPRCGRAISEVKRGGVATHFCRGCQPGLMIGR